MHASFETQHLHSFDDSVTFRAHCSAETVPIVAIHCNWVDRNRFYWTVMER